MLSLPDLVLSEPPLQKDSTEYFEVRDGGEVERMLDSWLRGFSKGEMNNDVIGHKIRHTKSLDCTANVKCVGWEGRRGRVIACKCFRGTQWSVTIRLAGKELATVKANVGPARESNFAAGPEMGAYFTSLKVLCEGLDRQIFPDKKRRTGLIVVTGATNSGKSEVTRGLIELRLQQAVAEHQRDPENVRMPHLITIEDPIEKFYIKNDDEAHPMHFHYTPREKGIDAPSVKSVLMDALRQTPTLVFVGEIRDPKDWTHVMNFAGTGHSIIGTAHASSLAESWGKILKAVSEVHPAGRSDVADRILGIVHLRSFAARGAQGVVPALWRYTLSGAKALVADGRSSLLPTIGLPSEEESSFGRRWFQGEILKRMNVDLTKARELEDGEAKAIQVATLARKIDELGKNPELDAALLRSDLEGL